MQQPADVSSSSGLVGTSTCLPACCCCSCTVKLPSELRSAARAAPTHSCQRTGRNAQAHAAAARAHPARRTPSRTAPRRARLAAAPPRARARERPWTAACVCVWRQRRGEFRVLGECAQRTHTAQGTRDAPLHTSTVSPSGLQPAPARRRERPGCARAGACGRLSTPRCSPWRCCPRTHSCAPPARAGLRSVSRAQSRASAGRPAAHTPRTTTRAGVMSWGGRK
jgi:hypothetical protein